MTITDGWLFALTLAATLGAGLMAGVFFAFSTFVMRALAQLPASQGIAAMQSINRVVINPMFLGVFLGTAGVCVAVIVGAIVRWDAPGAVGLVVGGSAYLVGTFLVTIVFNVPMNDALAAVPAADPQDEREWVRYVGRWTAWNHIRTAAALLALASFAVAIAR